MNTICVKCRIDMKVAKIGVVLVMMGESGPLEMRRCDTHECTECGAVITAPSLMAKEPESQHWLEGFADLLRSYDNDPAIKVVRYWQNAKARHSAFFDSGATVEKYLGYPAEFHNEPEVRG